MEIIIKQAAECDVDIIHQIIQKAFNKYAQDLGMPEKVSALNDDHNSILEDMKKKTILLAYIDGKPQGTIRYSIDKNKNSAYISRFGVNPDCHNSGIGKSLILEVEKRLKKQNIEYVTLHTASKVTNLVRFYYSLGYYVYSTDTDKGYIRVLLRKDLCKHQKCCKNSEVAL